MKRILDSPPDRINERTPSPSESWSILVDDMQNVIVNLLDLGTKQALSLTSKDAYQRWHHSFIDELGEYQIRDTSFQSAIFSSLLKDGHTNYILRYLRISIRRCTMNPRAALQIVASSISTRLEITSVLTWIINLHFYNVEHDLVLYREFDSDLLDVIIRCGSIAGFQWMQQQPWYDGDRLIPSSNVDDPSTRPYRLERAILKCGDARFFGYMANHTSILNYLIFSTHPCFFVIMAANAMESERIFDWKDLISTRETFQTQWQQLKNATSDNSFFAFLQHLLNNIKMERVVIAIWANIGNLWTELDTATQSRIKTTFEFQHADKLTLEHGYSRSTIEAVLQIGLPAAPTLTSLAKSTIFFDHISGEDPVLMDFLWASNDSVTVFDREICDTLSSNLIIWVKRNIDELSGRARSARFGRAVKWLQNHPFKYSEALACLIRDNHFLKTGETLA